MVALDDVKARMQKAVDAFSADIASMRTGRATSALVEDIEVGVYGGSTRMKILEVGTINVSDPQTITIQPWDGSIIGDIRKGIQEANVGLNPVIDGALIRISVPPLTQERRQEFVKLLHQRMEEAKVSLRQIRHDKIGEIKKASEEKEITEDDMERLEKQLQEETDKYGDMVDEVGNKKEEELMTV